MNFNREDEVTKTIIENLTKAINTSSFLGADYDDTYNNAFDAYIWEGTLLYDKITTDAGASKLVIIEKDKDYVFKVGFEGYWDSEVDIDEEGNETWNSYDRYFDYCSDYCELEYNLYNDAKTFFPGAERFLAAVDVVTPYTTRGIYIQERARFNIKKDTTISDNEIGEKIRSNSQTHGDAIGKLPDNWLESAIAYTIKNHCEEDFENFLNWLEENKINDIHSGNVGMIGDRPVLIDFSGYCED